MILALLDLLPARRRVRVAYLTLAVLSALLRAAGCLTLVPLLGALLSPEPAAALPWLGLLVALTAVSWVTDYVLADRGTSLGFALMATLQQRLLEQIRTLPLGWFTAARTGQVRAAITTSAPELFSTVVNLVTPAITAVVMPAGIAVGLFAVDWRLGLVATAFVPALLGALWAGGRLGRGADARYARANADANDRVVEFARAQPVLRAAGRAGASGSELGAALDRSRRASLRVLWFTLPGTLIFGLVGQLALLSMAGTTLWLGVTGQIGVPTVIALVVVVVRYLEPFTTLGDLAPALESARGTTDRVNDVLDAPRQAQPDVGATPRPSGVEFDRVSFGYGDDPVLDDVSFRVEPGTTTAVVGPSGSGKSTLLALVARFHDVGSGRIRVAGHDVRDYDRDTLAELLGVVFQDVYLFDTTIRENIRTSRPSATDDEVEAVAREAQVTGFSDRLPDGLDTPVGEAGTALSGGERQRVSIARALLKNAPVLLLDEATSALDTQNEAAITDAVSRAGTGRTVVVVAHRLSTIIHADRVVFLDGGRVVETGRPQELIERGGRFAGYWSRRSRATQWRVTVAP